MIAFESAYTVLVSLVFLAVGVGIIYGGIYNCIIVPRIPKSKRWAKTRGMVVGKNDYVVKSRRSIYDFRSGFNYIRMSERLIEYTVDGKIYRKSVSDDHRGAAHIYYKKSNPNYFKTVYEIKQQKREFGGIGLLILSFIMGAGSIAVSVLCLLELSEKLFG